ncbi:site-specific integrase [Pseudorhodoferax sp. LjRoot39]|uniref:tyrosine-type recombinase/integrase n=1 Tax=Pseudorhodoferax sp. LjRoot39 TaxID=3342328 RepID=UPI003ECF6965
MTFDQRADWQIYDDTGRRKYLTETEWQLFLSEANKLPRAQRALCHTLAFTGCRVSEALGLTGHLLDRAEETLIIRTLKRRRVVYRRVPIPRSLVVQLIAISQGQEAPFWTMHRVTAWRMVQRLMLDIGVRGPMACCKGLRHTFGMRGARCDLPPNILARFMGHSRTTTTAIYIDARGDEEREFAARMWNVK